MDDRLKHLMQELGNAINEALSDSERIAEAIGDIRHAGYDVFLVLEATIGFNKREDADDDSSSPSTATSEQQQQQLSQRVEADSQPSASNTKRSGPQRTSAGKIKLTTQDQKFLRALKISIDEES